jgi:nucleoside-diphosphate-sugar epimerase
MSTPLRVLVTGSAGRLGREAVRGLTAAGQIVSGFDRVPPAEHVGDLTDPVAVRRAVAGNEVVVHLAACPDDLHFPRKPPPDDGDNFLTDLVPANVVGLYHVLEACRTEGVRRVILASSGQVVDRHLDGYRTPVTVSMPVLPRYLYACTKVFAEAMGQVYALQHNLSVLAVRLGWCPRDAGQVAEIAADWQSQDVYLDPADAATFFAAAVAAVNQPPYAVVYATSRPIQQLQYDLEPARRLLGWEPRGQWPG